MGYKCETFNPGCNPLKKITYIRCDYKHDQIIQHKINGDPISMLPGIGSKKGYKRE